MKRLNESGCFLFICLAVLASWPLCAAMVPVTNTNDSGPGSLRDAITSAAPGDTIDFSLPYPATITLSTTLTISTNLSISGPGASNLAISGAGTVQVFSIGSGVTATISGLTIEYGMASYGGGIGNNGTLTLSNSTLSGNTAYEGGGIFNSPHAFLILNNTALSANSAEFGGGIYNNGSNVTISHSALSNNSALYNGGAVANNLGSGVVIHNTTLSNNSSLNGGAIYNSGGLTVTDSTLSGNSAGLGGGGIFTGGAGLTLSNSTLSGNSAGFGGGIVNQGTVNVMNSTLSSNSASSSGGIRNDGLLNVANSTLSNNSANSGGGGIGHYGGNFLNIKNTVLANNFAGGSCYQPFNGMAISGGHNLSDDFTCASFFVANGDLNSTPAGLDPAGLQDNGGPTKTIALLATSPAVDAIPGSPTYDCTGIDGLTPVAADQRGVLRPQAFGCDIGAYERKGFSSFIPKLGMQGRGFTLNATFTLSAGSAPIDPVTQTVRLQIGPYMVTIPAGSFHQAQGSNVGNWSYAGSINGVKLNVQISAQGGSSFQLNATGSPVSFSGVPNPVTVAIGIGFDADSTLITVNF